MNIPPFYLPSDLSKVAYFRAPTVGDSMDFAELNPDLEEANTTLFLNQIQNKEKSIDGKALNSAEWTGEDRRTALWWIFISTRDDPTITAQYDCSMCNETHYPSIPLPTLGENAVALSIPPAKRIDFIVAGQQYKATVRPLNGYALEHIEQLRMPLLGLDCSTKEHRRIDNDATLAELIHSIEVFGQPDDHNEAFEFKKVLISGMETQREYRPLVAMIEKALREMRHGLLMRYKEGRYLLVTEHYPPCGKEGEGILLLLPFRPFDFIPYI